MISLVVRCPGYQPGIPVAVPQKVLQLSFTELEHAVQVNSLRNRQSKLHAADSFREQGAIPACVYCPSAALFAVAPHEYQCRDGARIPVPRGGVNFVCLFRGDSQPPLYFSREAHIGKDNRATADRNGTTLLLVKSANSHLLSWVCWFRVFWVHYIWCSISSRVSPFVENAGRYGRVGDSPDR